MGGDNERRRFGKLTSGVASRDDISIGGAQRVEGVGGDLQAEGPELFNQIVLRVPEALWRRGRVTIPDQGEEMPAEPVNHSPRAIRAHSPSVEALAMMAPAARISSRALAESPGPASSPRIASSSTTTWNPSLLASNTVCLTQ